MSKPASPTPKSRILKSPSFIEYIYADFGREEQTVVGERIMINGVYYIVSDLTELSVKLDKE